MKNLVFGPIWPSKRKNGFLAQFGPLKIEKMDFWPNLDLPDLAEHGWGLPQYPPPIPNMPF